MFKANCKWHFNLDNVNVIIGHNTHGSRRKYVAKAVNIRTKGILVTGEAFEIPQNALPQLLAKTVKLIGGIQGEEASDKAAKPGEIDDDEKTLRGD